MGLSILIPVYNYPVGNLAHSLASQLQETGREGEIILLDDGSDPAFVASNEALQNLPFVHFSRTEKNIGRMAARLKLASLARFDYLLFLDADSEINHPGFLARYFEATDKNLSLVSGGRVYPEKLPACEYRLHWKYGTARESRKKNKQAGFMSNNFLVKKEIFSQLDHSISLSGYGHEDSLWGLRFEEAGIHQVDIDNPVLHGQLEKSESFLDKSTGALRNILLLETNVDHKVLSRHIKIYRVSQQLRKSGFRRLFLFFEKPFHGYFKKNLVSCNPSLFYFDCYRLAELLRMENLSHKGS